MAHPGTLPVANKAAILAVIRVGLAVGGEIANFSEFDRKNYFYPDIPKGYQISQYKYPIVSGGNLNSVALTRIHLEEDTATSKHDKGDFSLIDYNRAGVPLMELVTEPVITSAKEAGDFARELQLLLRTLGVSEANMEKGEMRVEANISLSDTPDQWGTKVEVKNLNSFRSAERAIEYELARMQALYEAGRESEIIQETRGWDEVKQSTFSQRSKESAHDYRYFPDPDLPKMMLAEVFDIEALKAGLPLLPGDMRASYQEQYAIKAEDTEVFVHNAELARFFEAVVSLMGHTKEDARLAANYITSDILGNLKSIPSALMPTPEKLAALLAMVKDARLTSRAAKDILEILMKEGGDPEAIAKEQGLLQENNEGALRQIAEEVVKENEKIVADIKAGKESALQALVGQVMKKTKGSANPLVTAKLLKEIIL